MKSGTARKYVQDARAASAAATGERILDGFMALVRERWLDEIRLEDVAALAEVSVQTVIRRFGGKDGLLRASAKRIEEQVQAERETPAGNLDRGVAALLRDYEKSGAIVIRLLAQEPRHEALKPLLDTGRAGHREWVAALCAPWLDRLEPAAREERLAALIIVTDVYAWQLLRNDQRRSVEETRRIIHDSLRAIIGENAQ